MSRARQKRELRFRPKKSDHIDIFSAVVSHHLTYSGFAPKKARVESLSWFNTIATK